MWRLVVVLSLTLHQVASVAALNQVIFKNYANASIFSKFTSLFPGLGYAAGYKVQQYARLITLGV